MTGLEKLHKQMQEILEYRHKAIMMAIEKIESFEDKKEVMEFVMKEPKLEEYKND